MLIASRFKRPTAPVELPLDGGGFKAYFFKPVDPSVPDSEHVADVTDPKHVQRLLSITEGYYVAEAETTLRLVATAAAQGALKPVATVNPPAANTAPPAPSGPASAPPQNAETPPAPARVPEADDAAAAAQELLAIAGLRAFKAALETASVPVLHAALTAETAKGDDERATYTKALRAALKG